MLAVAQWACQVALSFKVMRADDPFRDRYARGTRSMTASEIRAELKRLKRDSESGRVAAAIGVTAAVPAVTPTAPRRWDRRAASARWRNLAGPQLPPRRPIFMPNWLTRA